MTTCEADSTSDVNFEPASFHNYVRWAFGGRKPMALEYQEDKNFVSVKIKANFIPDDACKKCDKEGPHPGIQHVFKIIFTISDDGSPDMRIFNDANEQCIIPRDTEAFKTIERVFFTRGLANGYGNKTCYFYGTLDEDDPCMLYVQTVDLPQQSS